MGMVTGAPVAHWCRWVRVPVTHMSQEGRASDWNQSLKFYFRNKAHCCCTPEVTFCKWAHLSIC